MRKFALAAFCAALSTTAFSLPPGFTDTAYVSGLTQPTAMAFAPDGRIFVTQKTGAIKIVQSSHIIGTFATINCTSNSERGVLGIAFDPNFSTNNFVYVYYTTSATSLTPPATPKNRVSRFTANGNTVAAGSEVILLDNIPYDAGNHNAGCLRFGPDGKLYIATGDGGQDHTNSQNLTNLAGKILRINSSGTVPSDNPFFGVGGDRPEIYCYGLRNPFRFSFRPSNGALYIGDVGESSWEEVNVGVPGGNYGWNIYEGPTNVAGFISPALSYMHTASQSATVTGGVFMNLKRFAPPYDGSYFYGDYVRQTINTAVFNGSNQLQSDTFFTNANTPVDFTEGPQGDLWYVSIGQGSLRHIVYKSTFTNMTLSPTTVKGGLQSTATLTLDQPAPAAGAVFKITSSAGATVPASLSIHGGLKTTTFKVTTATTSTTKTVTITATRLGVTKTASLTVTP